MARTSWVWLCLLTLSGCGGAAAPAKAGESAAVDMADGQPMKGSRVSFWRPEGMHRPNRSLTLRLDSPLVVVGFAEFTAPNEKGTQEVLAGMKEGAKLSDPQPASRGSASGFSGAPAPTDSGMSKQVLGLASGNAVALVIVQYAAGGDEIAKHILDSVRLNAQAPLDPLGLYGLSIGDTAGFEVWDAMSQPILLAEKGARPPLAPTAASLALLTVPFPKADVSDEELGQMLGGAISDLKPDTDKAKGAELQVDGRPAFYMIAPGVNDGVPVTIYAFVVRGKESALVGFGHTGAGTAEKDVPRFERLAKSLKLDDAIIGAL